MVADDVERKGENVSWHMKTSSPEVLGAGEILGGITVQWCTNQMKQMPHHAQFLKWNNPLYIFVSPQKATYRDYWRRRCRRCRHPDFLVRSITLSLWVQIIPNLVCMFLAMTRSAVHKNCNYLFHFLIISL